MGRQRTGVDRILSLPNSYSIPLFHLFLIPTLPPSFPPLLTVTLTLTLPLIHLSLKKKKKHSNFTPNLPLSTHNFTPKPPNPLHPIPHPITIPHLRPPRSSPHCRHAVRTLFFLLFSNIKILLFLYIFPFQGQG